MMPNTKTATPMEDSLTKPLKDVLALIQERVVTESKYFGIPCQRSPTDFWMYQEIIFDLKPDVIIEIGNFCGGSALSLAHLCDQIGNGRVIGIDINHSRLHQLAKAHPRISFVTGDACEVFSHVANSLQKSETVLVIEDSSHEYQNTLDVLLKYSQLVSLGSYIIVEDSICHHGLDLGPTPGPYEAISDFIDQNPGFLVDRTKEGFLITWNPKGFLRRIS